MMQHKLRELAASLQKKSANQRKKTFINMFSVKSLVADYYKVKKLLLHSNKSTQDKVSIILHKYKLMLGLFLVFVSFLLLIFV
jgi:hypothetical protein